MEARVGAKTTPKVLSWSGALTQASGQTFLSAQPPSPKMAVLWDLLRIAPEMASNCLQIASTMRRSFSSSPTTTTSSTYASTLSSKSGKATPGKTSSSLSKKG